MSTISIIQALKSSSIYFYVIMRWERGLSVRIINLFANKWCSFALGEIERKVGKSVGEWKRNIECRMGSSCTPEELCEREK